MTTGGSASVKTIYDPMLRLNHNIPQQSRTQPHAARRGGTSDALLAYRLLEETASTTKPTSLPRTGRPMSAGFLSNEQERRYGRYAGDPSRAQLDRYFHLDAADRELVEVRRAEMERDLIRERTLDGLAAAHAQGRRGGRPSALDADTLAVAIAIAIARQARGESATARHLGIGRSTLYRALGEPQPT